MCDIKTENLILKIPTLSFPFFVKQLRLENSLGLRNAKKLSIICSFKSSLCFFSKADCSCRNISKLIHKFLCPHQFKFFFKAISDRKTLSSFLIAFILLLSIKFLSFFILNLQISCCSTSIYFQKGSIFVRFREQSVISELFQRLESLQSKLNHKKN